MATTAILESTLTCPRCGHSKMEVMPTDACHFRGDGHKVAERAVGDLLRLLPVLPIRVTQDGSLA
jgi:hypothetical protein